MRHVHVACACVLLVCGRPALAQEPDTQAVNRAKGFLDSARPWTFINLCMHLGTEFQGHRYANTLPVTDRNGVRVPGQFALVYDYQWTGNGQTQLAFHCDTRGNIHRVQVLADNGVINQPFVLADGSIKLVGDALYDALKQNLGENDQRLLRQLVAAAASNRLLHFGLRVLQANP